MYTMTLKLNSSAQVLKILESLPKNTAVTLDRENAPTPPMKGKTKAKQMNGATPLIQTGKKPTKGSKREKFMRSFEKLEVKHGVGHVTRQMMRDQLVKLKEQPQVLYQLVHEGYLQAADS